MVFKGEKIHIDCRYGIENYSPAKNVIVGLNLDDVEFSSTHQDWTIRIKSGHIDQVGVAWNGHQKINKNFYKICYCSSDVKIIHVNNIFPFNFASMHFISNVIINLKCQKVGYVQGLYMVNGRWIIKRSQTISFLKQQISRIFV